MPDQPRERLPSLLGAADVFVHASLFEMMPISFLEALSCSLPVISHRHPVMRWMTGDAGLAVDMAAPGELAEAFGQLYREPIERARRGEMARERALQKFSRRTVIDAIVDMYDAVSRDPGNREDG